MEQPTVSSHRTQKRHRLALSRWGHPTPRKVLVRSMCGAVVFAAGVGCGQPTQRPVIAVPAVTFPIVSVDASVTVSTPPVTFVVPISRLNTCDALAPVPATVVELPFVDIQRAS